MHRNQAIVAAAGELTYRSANIPTVGDEYVPLKLANGDAYHFQGWTIMPTGDGVSFTHDETGHGMTVSTDQNVKAF